MNWLIDNYLFGIFLCLAAFSGSVYLRTQFNLKWLNPLMLSIVCIILIITLFDIPYKSFAKGGSVIHAFLGPVTVVLALPLYRQKHLLIQHKYAILVGVTSGVIASLASVVLFSRWLGLSAILERSIMPHSVTTPIGIGVVHSLNGIEGITVLSIVITGVFGALISPIVLKLFRITNPIAKGISIGTASHAIGTTKAMEMGETEGAMSGLAIGTTAIITVITVVLLKLIDWY